ncbi:mitochondrial assembly of ribosomal large subunit protein 1 [Caerostris darwini]|uniref:Mitochondrial assembly of ribosomal large subunit protein 1 n=1 Tax=Caerostris darwini TaxID=1538125 RepID=A0AAV4VIF3_9ARAC|nr:mitochondrial assembly of ribosomal large subunit protein 1 [Caerostris darwini]
MNRSSYKQLRCIALFWSNYSAKQSFLQRRYLSNIKENALKASSVVSKSHCRNIFTSNATKSDAKSHKHTTDEPTPNFENDDEFQSILKDFAKDFNLNIESDKVILEDIKKTLHQPEIKEGPSSGEKHSKSSIVDHNLFSVGEKYKEFTESDSLVIPSHEEIQSGSYEEELFHIDQDLNPDLAQLQYKRGVTGVFDIDELVELLHKENLVDTAVISVPKEMHYTNFLVITTAKSPRHSKAATESIMKVYKMKKHKKDPFIIVEGKPSKEWKALDMGNIVLHIFLEDIRAFYDIETLWLFDQEFDTGGKLKPDPIYDALEEQMAFFNSLQESRTKENLNEVT